MPATRPSTFPATAGATFSATQSDPWESTAGSFTQVMSDTDDDGLSSDGAAWRNAGYFGTLICGWTSYSVFDVTTLITGAWSFSTGGAIPQGTQIDSAILTLDVDAIYGDPNFNWHCEDTDAAAQPASDNEPIDWSPGTSAFTNEQRQVTGILTVDLKDAVQEVIDRDLWDEGRINIFTRNQAGTSANASWDIADIYPSGTPAVNPTLVIIWS